MVGSCDKHLGHTGFDAVHSIIQLRQHSSAHNAPLLKVGEHCRSDCRDYTVVIALVGKYACFFKAKHQCHIVKFG